MTGIFVYLSFPCVVLVSIVLFLIRAQSQAGGYDLRDMLFQEDCAPPCFMGLHPGVTTAHDAATLLREHIWVDSVENRLVGGQGGYIYWYWNARHAPGWIDTQARGVIWIAGGRVDQMWVGTKFALGELLLQLGNPDIEIVDENIDYGHGLYQYRGVYGAAGLVTVSWQLCAAADPYRASTTLKFREAIGAEALDSMDYLDQWKYTFNNCNNK